VGPDEPLTSRGQRSPSRRAATFFSRQLKGRDLSQEEDRSAREVAHGEEEGMST